MASKRRSSRASYGAGAAVIAIIAGTCLVISLFAAGFTACATPWATRSLSAACSDFETAPYLPEDVVNLAVATRDYTVSDCGRASLGTEGARETFSRLLVESAQRATAAGSSVGNRWSEEALAIMRNADADADANAVSSALANVSERYGLTQDALRHLDDCYALISAVKPWLVGIAVAAGMLLAALIATGRQTLAGKILCTSPIALAALMAACAIWAALDFNGFFGAFHALLFPQGNWTFPADSLLICMLPLDFWMSMAALWLAVTVLACIIAMLMGKRLKRDTAPKGLHTRQQQGPDAAGNAAIDKS